MFVRFHAFDKTVDVVLVCVFVGGGGGGGEVLLRKGSLGLLWSKILYMDAKINVLCAEYPEHWFILPASLKQIRMQL